MTPNHSNPTPHEQRLAEALDRDAASLRAEPDAGFESRVLSSALHAQPESPVIAVISPRLRPLLALAAAAAVLLTVGTIAVVSVRSAPSTPPASTALADADDVLADIDAWLALDNGLFGRVNFASFREELDSADAPVSFDDLGRTNLDLEEWM